MAVKVVNNAANVKNIFVANKKKALVAIGLAAVEVTTDYMQYRYGKPIRQTGDLMRSITSAPEYPNEDSVTIGSNIEYAPWVHDGTFKMTGRPFLKDAILENKDIWQEVAEENLRQGFD